MINQEPVPRGRGIALPVLRGGPAALLALGVIVAAATGTAFAESYDGLFMWAGKHLVHGFWQSVWPLQVDAFIAAGELSLFLSALYPWLGKVRPLAWTVSVTGLAISIGFNAGHVGKGASAWAQFTAALPPIAAIGGLMIALAVVKRIAHTIHQSAPVDAPLSSPALTESGTLRAPWMPSTPAARVAVTYGMAIDLTAAVAEVTAAVERVTEVIVESALKVRPVPGLVLAPGHLGSAAIAGGTRTYTVAPAIGRSTESVTLELPESGSVPAGPDVRVFLDTAAERALDEVRLQGLTSESDPVPQSPGMAESDAVDALLTKPDVTVALDAVRLSELPNDADRIRTAIARLGRSTTPGEISAWLALRGVIVARENIRSTLRRTRQQNDDKTGKPQSTAVVSVGRE